MKKTIYAYRVKIEDALGWELYGDSLDVSLAYAAWDQFIAHDSLLADSLDDKPYETVRTIEGDEFVLSINLLEY